MIGNEVIASNRDSAEYHRLEAMRKPDDAMVRVMAKNVDWDGTPLPKPEETKGWVTASEIENGVYTAHEDQTYPYEKTSITYADVTAGNVPWLGVIHIVLFEEKARMKEDIAREACIAVMRGRSQMAIHWATKVAAGKDHEAYAVRARQELSEIQTGVGLEQVAELVSRPFPDPTDFAFAANAVMQAPHPKVEKYR